MNAARNDEVTGFLALTVGVRVLFRATSVEAGGTLGGGLWDQDPARWRPRAVLLELLPVSVLGSTAYLLARRLPGRPWRSDGTAPGTQLVVSGFPGAHILNASRTRLLISSDFTPHLGWLWLSDGTASGTVVVRPGPGRFLRGDGAEIGNRVFFGYADEHGFEPWASDGSAAGTQLRA
jgi:hypothetical protein